MTQPTPPAVEARLRWLAAIDPTRFAEPVAAILADPVEPPPAVERLRARIADMIGAMVEVGKTAEPGTEAERTADRCFMAAYETAAREDRRLSVTSEVAERIQQVILDGITRALAEERAIVGPRMEALQAEVERLRGQLARIAEAHQKHVDGHGGTWGDCQECGQMWPCPTYVWATTTSRNPDVDCWDPNDDEAGEGQ